MLSKHINVQIPLTLESLNFKIFQVFSKVFLNIKATQHSNKNPPWSFVPLELEGTSSQNLRGQLSSDSSEMLHFFSCTGHKA